MIKSIFNKITLICFILDKYIFSFVQYFKNPSITFFKLHAVSRMQQDRQRELSVKTLSVSAELWRHCMLRGGVERCAQPRHLVKEMKILIIFILEWEQVVKLCIFKFYHIAHSLKRHQYERTTSSQNVMILNDLKDIIMYN